MEWPDPALKVRDRARFARCTACSPRLSDDACRVPAELGARGATAPAREGAGAAAAGGRTACRPAQQRPTQRPPAQQPEQPVRALRGEYCRPAALRRPGGSTRWTAPAREGAGAAAAGGRAARQPAQQRPAQRPPAQQPDQPVRALRGEYCRPAALRRPGGSTRSSFASRARAEAPAARARPAASRRRRNMAYGVWTLS